MKAKKPTKTTTKRKTAKARRVETTVPTLAAVEQPTPDAAPTPASPVGALLTAEILEKPELATAIRSALVVTAVNEAVTRYGAKLAVATLQRSLKACGCRQWVDEQSGRLGPWTVKNVNRTDPDKLLHTFKVELALLADVQNQQAKAS